MLLSWLEDDVTSERRSHTHFADAIAIAACIAAALLVHHHHPKLSDTRFAAARAPHGVVAAHPSRLRSL
jgi:hypothetical protein